MIASGRPVVRAESLSKSVPTSDGALPILRDCNVEISAGLTAVVGPSGAGKTSLLYCLSGLDRPDAGTSWVNDVDIYGLNEEMRSCFLRDNASFVFQEYNLIPYLSVGENIELSFALSKRKLDRDLFAKTLDRLGLSHKRDSRVSGLSGGEQQRAALCRAIIAQSSIVFADEPTGALDTVNTSVVLRVLCELADAGRTVVMVTHDVESASRADRIVFMRDGEIVHVTGPMTSNQIAAQMTRLGNSGAEDVSV